MHYIIVLILCKFYRDYGLGVCSESYMYVHHLKEKIYNPQDYYTKFELIIFHRVVFLTESILLTVEFNVYVKSILPELSWGVLDKPILCMDN